MTPQLQGKLGMDEARPVETTGLDELTMTGFYLVRGPSLYQFPPKKPGDIQTLQGNFSYLEAQADRMV